MGKYEDSPLITIPKKEHTVEVPRYVEPTKFERFKEKSMHNVHSLYTDCVEIKNGLGEFAINAVAVICVILVACAPIIIWFLFLFNSIQYDIVLAISSFVMVILIEVFWIKCIVSPAVDIYL